MRSTGTRLAAAAALLSTGLLCGAFVYGWANVVPTFGSVPLDVHLVFRVALMRVNAPVMQSLMGLACVTSGVLAATCRGRARTAALAATGLALVSLLVTKYGNVPINLEIKQWAAGSPPADQAERLRAWDVFNDVRVGAAALAFALVVLAADVARPVGRTSTATNAYEGRQVASSTDPGDTVAAERREES